MDEVEAEAHTLGALIHSPPEVLRVYLTEINLRPEDFSSPFRSSVFEAIIALVDEGARPDVALLTAKVGSRQEIEEYAAYTPEIGNLRHYAEAVKENARWRRVKEAGELLTVAADRKDRGLEAQADALLTSPVEGISESYTPDQLAELVLSRFEGEKEESFSFPFLGLTMATGGLRRGEVLVLSGHTSHGKSVLLSQFLHRASKDGHKAWLYINEMKPLDFADRFLAGEAGISFSKLRRGDLDQEEMNRLVQAMNHIPYGVTNIAGWSAQEIARHIRFHGADIVGIDIVNLIPHDDEKDMRQISQAFNQVSKTGNCAVVYTAHLNEKRVQSAIRPRPTLGDIRQSGQIKNDADYVMFVYRKQDSNGIPLDTGEAEVYLAKGRNSALESLNVWLNPKTMNYQELPWQ